MLPQLLMPAQTPPLHPVVLPSWLDYRGGRREKRLDGQWRGNLGFDLKFAVEVDSGGVAITNGGVV